MDVRPVSITALETGAQVLMYQHYLETEPEPRPPLDIDWQRLLRLEMAGCLVTLAAFDGDEIVGYAVSVVAPHPHFAGTPMCLNDSLFVASHVRGKGLGKRLMAATEEAAVERGVGKENVIWQAVPESPLERLLSGTGYRKRSVWYSRKGA